MMAGRSDALGIKQLLGKMRNPDADFRFMALNDLISEYSRQGEGVQVDEPTEKQTVDLVLELVNDKNTEVKNQAVKALGVLVKRVSDPRMTTIADRLVVYAASGDDQQRDLAGLALKTVISEIPPTSRLAPTLCTKLAPKLLTHVSDSSASPDTVCAALDALTDLFGRFDGQFRANAAIQSQALAAIVPLLMTARPAVSKRAVSSLGSLCASGGDEVFTHLMNRAVLPSLRGTSIAQLKPTISLLGVLARAVPGRLANKIPEIIEPIVKSASSPDEELRELGLQNLEHIVLKCPTESIPFVPMVVAVASDGLRYDPNYAGADEDEEDIEMNDDVDQDEDADDGDFGDEYSDDDDVSWKVRRASAKLLTTLIATRPNLLGTFSTTVAPLLLSRFAEREESVRVEIWTTYIALLKQAKAFDSSSGPASRPTESTLKRKRESTSYKGADDPIALLRSQASAVSKSIIKLLGTKSVQVRHVGFLLLHELVEVLSGGLDTHIGLLVTRAEATLRSSDSGLSGAATNLKIQVLGFLALFFGKHDVQSVTPELPKLVALLVAATQDKFHRVASDAFAAASALVRALCSSSATPSSTAVSSASIHTIFDAALERLRSPFADQDVKERAVLCLADVLTYAGDGVSGEAISAFEILGIRLDNEVTRSGAVRACAQIARSKTLPPALLETWSQNTLPSVAMFLRKNNRALRLASFHCLEALLERSQDGITITSGKLLISELQPIIASLDLQLLPLAFNLLSAAIRRTKDLNAEECRQAILPALDVMVSPVVQGPAVDALLGVITALAQASIPTHEAVALVTSRVSLAADVETIKGASGAGLQPYFTAARGVGAIVKAAPAAAPAIISETAQSLSVAKVSSTQLFFSLLVIGECGRVIDLSSQASVFNQAASLFGSSSEDIRTSAAFAVGNIAAGAPATFLERILHQIQGQEKRRYLALQALKEVIVHASPLSVLDFCESLWNPLFSICESEDEATRTVAAECLGKLTLSDPAKFLPRLQTRLQAQSPRDRLTSVAALRFTLTDTSSAFDVELGPYLADFFSHTRDPDLSVRAVALSALNSAAHNKPTVLLDNLSTLLPDLYAETVIDARLVRFVEMGPFKHRVDDGLETRKLAYATMLTLLDTCLSKIEINEYLTRVLAGISDEDEIKVLCYLMMIRLSHIAPAAMTSRLDEAADSLSQTLSVKVKDDAVKQDRERVGELQRSALRALAALHKLASPVNTPKFSQLLRDAAGNRFASELQELIAREESVHV